MDDYIDRQAAIDAPERFTKDCNPEHFVGHSNFIEYMDTVGIRSFGNWQYANGFNMGLTAAEVAIEKLPSAQPERRCVNCGRTVNNGGWYEDGRTRCPIEEHYALPKDGYCHLWEKRKDWEDAYVKRAEEGEK